MADVPISGADIEKLGAKLDELGEVLTPNERAILLAVFGLAATAFAEATSRSQETESGAGLDWANGLVGFENSTLVRPIGELPSLSDGFIGAFSAGSAGNFKIAGLDEVASVGVGGSTVTWER